MIKVRNQSFFQWGAVTWVLQYLSNTQYALSQAVFTDSFKFSCKNFRTSGNLNTMSSTTTELEKDHPSDHLLQLIKSCGLQK